jgi:tetratricopeptide (TPR) repeat protein
MFLKSLFRLIPKDPLTKGLQHFNRGRLTESIAEFAGLLDSQDEEIRKKARLYTCEAHLQLGDEAAARNPQRACEHYEQARALQPTFADIQNKLGEVYRDLGRIEEAEACFEESLEINPRYFAAAINLSNVRVHTQGPEHVAQDVARIAEWCPPMYREKLQDLVQACQTDAPIDWDARFREIREMAPTRVQVGKQSALTAIQRGDAPKAIEILEELLREHDRFPDLHLLLGLARGSLGQHEEAIAAFRQALAINEHYLKARINLGITYMELDRLDEARTELERALQTDPGNSLAKSALAEIEALQTAS